MKRILALLGAFAMTASAASLDEGFRLPPEQTKPWCYWYWISDNISKEGLTRDLEAMARVGIGEALIGNVVDPDTPLGNVRVFSDAWWALLEHAVREGRRVGVNLGVFNGPGWSQSGGPWVTPQQTMRYVVSSETRVKGPVKFAGRLPAPKEPFQDIAVLAFPAPRADAETISSRVPRVQCTPPVAEAGRLVDGDLETGCPFPKGAAGKKQPFIVDIELAEAFIARSLALHPMDGDVYVRCDLQAADEAGVFRTVRAFTMDRRGLSRPQYSVNVGPMIKGPAVVAFAPVASRHFRLVVTNLQDGGGLAEINLSGAARLDRFVEKELGKMHPTPLPQWDSYHWPPAPEPDAPDLAVAPSRIRNLTDQLAADGTLRWDVPEGEWIILRSGMTPTGATNHPTTEEGRGPECDKMNRAAIEAHFNGFFGKLLERMPKADRSALRHVIIDSYEVGSQNWTDGFGEQFQAAFGYDPRPWLPVLTGRIVGTADQSDRFLWDLRRLVADRIARDYVGGLREISHRHGLRLWLENYGHWGFPAEFLQYGGQSDDLGGEFWVRDGGVLGSLGSIELRAASSAAHLYGKRIVSSEAFTSARAFRDYPAGIKALGDWSYCQGINHLVLHVYIHQPWQDKVPGVNAWFGTEFNRHNTWFEQSKTWIDYLRRCHFLLQQGRSDADVAYFIGEDTPKMTGTRQPELPAGYDYDYINAEALLSRVRVERGRLVLPDGPAYGLLVLPPQETMRPELLRKLRDLVAAGAAILGPPPKRSPSLQNFPASDQEVKRLAAELWGELAQPAASGLAERAFGKGRVFRGDDIAEALRCLQTAPAITCPAGILWTLRKTDTADFYFLSNQKDQPALADVSFRVAGRTPEFWHPDTGVVEPTAWFAAEGDRTRVPVALDPHGSVFVVFRKAAVGSPVVKASKDGQPLGASAEPCPIRLLRRADGGIAATVTQPGRYTLDRADGRQSILDTSGLPAPITLVGPWRVRFPSGVSQAHDWPQLISWSENSDDAVRHFSGTASYETQFHLPAEKLGPGRRLTLDLGRVEVIAEVRVNGKDLGTLWKRPFAVDITDAVSPGSNTIEIKVTNNWWNRLVGDDKLPANQRTTFTTAPPRSPRKALLPSGLLGPVTLRTAEQMEVK